MPSKKSPLLGGPSIPILGEKPPPPSPFPTARLVMSDGTQLDVPLVAVAAISVDAQRQIADMVFQRFNSTEGTTDAEFKDAVDKLISESQAPEPEEKPSEN